MLEIEKKTRLNYRKQSVHLIKRYFCEFEYLFFTLTGLKPFNVGMVKYNLFNFTVFESF